MVKEKHRPLTEKDCGYRHGSYCSIHEEVHGVIGRRTEDCPKCPHFTIRKKCLLSALAGLKEEIGKRDRRNEDNIIEAIDKWFPVFKSKPSHGYGKSYGKDGGCRG